MSKNEHDVTSPMGHPDDKEKNLAVQHFDQHSHSESHTMTMNDMDPNTLRKPGEDRFDHVLSPEERTTALRLAMEADPGPDILSWRYMLFVFTAFIAILNSGDNGFDGTVMSSVNSMEQFQNFFGLDGAAAGGTSLVFGLYTVGQVCAFFLNIYLPDKVGRRWAMFIPNILQCTGAIISANAKNMPMFLFGRWLTGFGCTAANTAAKSYVAEITSPNSRGRWMGVLNSFYYVGQILAAGISIPFGRASGEESWRGPMYLQCGPAGINLIFILFLAESPRWLYARGKKDQARAVLAKFHSKTGDPYSPLIDLEIHEFEQNIDLAGTDREFWNFKTLFNTFGARYRFGLCAMVSVWGQLSGNGLITYFLPVLLEQAGIVSTDRQRVLNLANSVTSMAGALTGSALVDHVGRRKLMLFAAVSCVIGMVVAGGLLSPAGEQTQMRANAGISFIFLFMVFFSAGWTPLQALYPAEVLSYENRAKGLALQGWVTNAVSTINTFGMPIALREIGYINYFIFAAFDVLGLVLIWFFVVETKKLALEEIDDIFVSRKPKQRSFELFAEAKERAKHEREMQRLENA